MKKPKSKTGTLSLNKKNHTPASDSSRGISSKQKIHKMQINRENLDYDHANMRRHPGEGRFFFDAWIQEGEYQEDHKIWVVDFLEYCKETNLIHSDAHISHTKNYISIPVEIPAFDAGRDECFSGYGKPREYTFEEFFADWSCAGLTEALTKFLNDSRICAG